MPGPNKTFGDVSHDSTQTEELFSDSIPTLVRLQRVDSSTAKAYDREQDTLISSGNHATVIQDAINHVDTNYSTNTSNNSTPALHDVRIVGAIDGGYETFLCDDQIQLLDQIKLQNIDLNFNNNSISGGLFGSGIGVVAQPDGTDALIENLRMENATIRNVGSGGAAKFEKPAWGLFRDCTFKDTSGVGLVETGAIGMVHERCRFINNDAAGVQPNDTADIDGNFNSWLDCDFYDNGNPGLHARKTNATADQSDIFIVRRCNFQNNDTARASSYGLSLGENIRTAQIVNNWFETSQKLVVGEFGACDHANIQRNKVQNITVSNSTGTEIRENFTESGAALNITIESGATDTLLADNELGTGSITNNGTNTSRKGVIVAAYHLSSDQTTSSGSVTDINYQTAIRDTHNAYDTSSSTFTAPTFGTYLLFNQIAFGFGSTDTVHHVLSNISLSNANVGGGIGLYDHAGDQVNNSAGGHAAHTFEIVTLDSGDTATPQAFQNSGSDKDLSSARTRFLAMLIA